MLDWEHRLIQTLAKRRDGMLGKESVGGWRGAGVQPELRLGVQGSTGAIRGPCNERVGQE